MAKPKGNIPKLRPEKDQDGRVKHGLHSLERILEGQPDARYAPVKECNAMQAALVESAGGADEVRANPLVFMLIKRMAHLHTKCGQWEKMSLIGETCLGDKRYTAMIGKLKLYIETYQDLVFNSKKATKVPTIREIIEQESSK
ncbi:MAG: hypothetical protein JSU72_13145 [Deltaproteobacteria bacterium]|nr:MAG: hypothetical protein JSU72_13145 [Deltaproteobacteria bacterium]